MWRLLRIWLIIVQLFITGCIHTPYISTYSEEVYPVPPFPYRAVVADFDMNGWLDIAVVSKYSDITVFLNPGEHKPFRQFTLKAYFQPVSLTKGDFNGDGMLDLIPMTEALIGPVYLGKDNGSFERKDIKLSAPLFANFIEAADLNNDGLYDLVACGFGGEGPYIYINRGDLSFDAIAVKLRSKPVLGKSEGITGSERPFLSHNLFIYDVDGDGMMDILIPDESMGILWLLHNKGSGQFEPVEVFKEAGSTPVSVSAMTNPDNKTLIILALNKGAEDSELVYLKKDLQHYSVAERHKVPHIGKILIADMDKDGQYELIANIVKRGKSFIAIYRANHISEGTILEVPVTDPRYFTTGDIDNDGFQDLIIPDYGDNTLKIIFSPLRKR